MIMASGTVGEAIGYGLTALCVAFGIICFCVRRGENTDASGDGSKKNNGSEES